MIKGKNEFGNLIPVPLDRILLARERGGIHTLNLKNSRILYLSEIDKPELLKGFTKKPLKLLRRRFETRFVGKFKPKSS